MNTKDNPLFLLLTWVMVIIGLITLQKEAPQFIPVIFCISLVGIPVRFLMIRRERRRRKDSHAVISFEKLQKINFIDRGSAIKENLRGHDEVVDRLVLRIQQNLSIASPHRTLGAFMLVGPTGTGKTYFAELVAKALYPKSPIVFLRMNQYKTPQDVSTLLGPPPGYAGYEIGGSLTRPVIENPYRIVILDELEKSHQDIRHCLYDILDRAQCSEKSSGKTAHFGACVFIATCNNGVESLRTIWAETKDPMMRAGRARDTMAREGFEKAFLARFDGIMLMDRLTSVAIAEVACLQITKHWLQYGIEVTYASPELLVETVRRNKEFQDYGVRQIASLIQESSGPLIERARKGGARKVKLDLDVSSGNLQIEES